MLSTPYWLKKRLTFCDNLAETKRALAIAGLNTVCESSLCPNLNECYSAGRATFLILGRACTRACKFCGIGKTQPEVVDPEEPAKILKAVVKLGLKYIVVTSVTRDDLDDGGASQFARVIEVLKSNLPGAKIEVLVPDFNGSQTALEAVLAAGPNVFSHNIETVSRLYPVARPMADYKRSLGILRSAKRSSRDQLTKSSIMVGLGEEEREVIDAIKDIYETGCDMLVIGQYLRPGRENMGVSRFVRPEEFENYRKIGKGFGFRYVASAPFARSSYLAENIFGQLEETNHERDYATVVS